MSPPARNQTSLARDQRPHPQFGLEDSQEPWTNQFVSKAWYGTHHSATPVRSYHLLIESPRKVEAQTNPFHPQKPLGWHLRSLGSPWPVLIDWDNCVILGGDKQEVVPVENPVFRFLFSISSRTSNLVHRPVLQLRLNNETPVFPPVLYLPLAHKAISTNHNNISRLQGNSSSLAIIITPLFGSFLRGEVPCYCKGFLQPLLHGRNRHFHFSLMGRIVQSGEQIVHWHPSLSTK